MPKSQIQEVLAVLLEAGRITDEQVKAVEQEQKTSGKPLDVLLVEKKMVEDEVIAKAKSTVTGVPYVDLVGREIPPQTINIIPKDVSVTTRSVVFERQEEVISVGMIDPRDADALQAIEFLTQNNGLRPKYFLISNASLNYVLKRYEALGKEIATALVAAKEKYVVEPKKVEAKAGAGLEEVIKGAPVSRIVSVIFKYAVDGGASDIHIEPYGDETRVRYRIDGVLRTILTVPKYIHASVVSRIKVLANLKLDETRIPQDGRISEIYNNKPMDFRISTLPLAETEKVVIRLLDTTKGVPTLEQLGFRKEYVETIKAEIKKPHGMFLITGPTGSGKSTTLFTVLNMRNEEGINISTLEDPVEYYIKGVNQSQVRPEVGFSFAAGLRALLRQDPNVIMVGEIRDGETGELAVHAALTGHLIFSTLHTNDAFGVVPRLIDMKVEPFLLSATINLAIAQRLARKICERCKMPVVVPPELEVKFRGDLAVIPDRFKAHLEIKADKPLTIYKGRGCLRCADTGYHGRVAVAEVLMFDDPMRLLVTQGFPMDKVEAAAKKQGMLTLMQDGLLKALEGSTTLEEVLRITAD